MIREVAGGWIRRLFYPAVPAVVTAHHQGEVGGLLVLPSTLSFDPPMVGVSINPESNTHRLIDASGVFGVCIVGYEHVISLARLAEKAPGVRDKLTWAGFEHEWGRMLQVPIIRGSAAWLECVVDSRLKLGDHTLFVGLVKAACADEDFEGYWQYERYRPVFYVGNSKRFKDSYVSLLG